jgi:hypothetical protein
LGWNVPCAVAHWAWVSTEQLVPLAVVTQHGARKAQMSPLPHSVPAPLHDPVQPAWVVIVHWNTTDPGTIVQHAPDGGGVFTQVLLGPHTEPSPRN